MVQLRYEAGTEHKGSLLTAEADFLQAEFEVREAKRNVLLAEKKLTKVLGRKKFIPIKVNGDFDIRGKYKEIPDFEELADTSSFFGELVAKKELLYFNLESAKSDFFPQVSLDGSIGNSSFSWPPDDGQWSVGFGLSFPIFEKSTPNFFGSSYSIVKGFTDHILSEYSNVLDKYGLNL
mgnify:CR=1 FL=1